MRLKIHSAYQPAGDQPEAIRQLVKGLSEKRRDQVLLGVTGSGKTFTMAHVIEHVHDPAALLRESYRVLKPGGVMVVLTPNIESWGHARFGKNWFNLDPPRHLVLFSRKTLGKVAEREGFRISRLETTVRTCWVYGSMSRQLQRTDQANLADLGKPSALIYGIIYQLRERLMLRSNPDAGDELLLIARKE